MQLVELYQGFVFIEIEDEDTDRPMIELSVAGVLQTEEDCEALIRALRAEMAKIGWGQ